MGSVYRQFVHFVPEARLLREGDEVDGWAVVEFPGHADGHICLLKDGMLIAGDHLLPRITPAVGLYPDSRPDPLGDFLASLERVAELAPRLALPGTGSRSTTPPVAPARSSSTTASGSTRPRRRSATARRSGYALSCVLFPASWARPSGASPSPRRSPTRSVSWSRAGPRGDDDGPSPILER